MRDEIRQMADLKYLPVLKRGCKAHYEGSIDKTGGNSDWDWWLYQDKKGEWVLFDYEGPGCIYNFVQHRYPDCPEPTFRFYFDGEEEPRFTIRHSQFGEVYPFVEPLSSRYIGPPDHGRGPIRVVRSYAPMPFAKACRITSDVKLEGNDRQKGEGGWGHVMFHAYSEDTEVRTFSPEDDYTALIALWKNVGSPVIPFSQGEKAVASPFTLAPGECRRIFRDESAGLISGIQVRTRDYQRKHLSALELRAVWDGHSLPDVKANFGCLFANELGYHGVRYLLSGMDADGGYYHFYPMPYRESAVMEIANNGDSPITVDYISVNFTKEYNEFYKENPFGYFRTSPYYTRKHTEGADSRIASLTGSGHIVGSIITAFGETPDSRADCEGDLRVHFDGIRTPQIESDGSESYSCYGWGFETPQECNPSSGYDGHEHKDWSMTRLLTGDWYPFLSGVEFSIESGWCNDYYMEHSGMVFYYGAERTDTVSGEKATLISEIVMGDAASEAENGYRSLDDAPLRELESYFEGDDDHILVRLQGRDCRAGSRFTVTLPQGTDFIIIRRVSDQKEGRQRARVFVDGRRVEEYPWYFADRNPCKRFLEDEFVVPSAYLKGKTQAEIRIVPEPVDGKITFNEFGYRIYSVAR